MYVHVNVFVWALFFRVSYTGGGAARFTDIGMAVLSYYKRLAFAILKKLIILDCCFL